MACIQRATGDVDGVRSVHLTVTGFHSQVLPSEVKSTNWSRVVSCTKGQPAVPVGQGVVLVNLVHVGVPVTEVQAGGLPQIFGVPPPPQVCGEMQLSGQL